MNKLPPEAIAMSREGIGILSSALSSALESDRNAIEIDQAEFKRKIQLDEVGIEHVLDSFGRAVVNTQLGIDGTNECPAVTLRGTMNTYNRYGQNWRIVVDKAKLYERESNRGNKSDVLTKEQNSKEEVIFTETQILAYSDI